MLSLRRSMREIDETEAAQRAAAQAFAETAETAAKHVVEVDPDEAHRFRQQVLGLAERLGEKPSADELSAARGLFQNELRDYAAKAGVDIRRLKEELSAAAQAMQSFAQGISTSGNEHETVLNREFQLLTRAADDPDVRTVRAAIHETVATVTSSYQELKQAHSLVVAQLRDEIRVLHQERHRQQPLQDSGLTEKRILDSRIEEMLRRRQAFRLMLVGVPQPSIKSVPPSVQDRAIQEFVRILRALSPGGDNPAQCSPRLYAVILPAKGPVPDTTAWQQQLATCHVFQEGGIPRTLRVEPRVTAIEYAAGDPPTLFFGRLSAASEDLERTP